MGGPPGYNVPLQLDLWSYWYFDASSVLPIPTSQPKLPFLATLDLPDLSHLTNDPYSTCSISGHLIPAKLPSDIPKFDGKPREGPK
jgi:hypothetical protein